MTKHCVGRHSLAPSAQCCPGSRLLRTLYQGLPLVSVCDSLSSLSILFCSSTLSLLKNIPTIQNIFFFLLQSFSFSLMGLLQDSPFYKPDWLSATTSERKHVKDNLLITSTSLPPRSTLSSAAPDALSLPLLEIVPSLASQATVSRFPGPVCTRPQKAPG